MPISRDESEQISKAIQELGLLIQILAQPEPEPQEIEISPERIRRAKAMQHMEKLLEEMHQYADAIQQKMSEIDFTFQLIKAAGYRGR